MTQEDWRVTFARDRLNFDDDSTRNHFLAEPPKPGDDLILHMTHFHTNRYKLVRVASVRNTAAGKPSKIILEKGDSWGGAAYWISGKSSFHPKGQTRLLPLVPSVAAVLNHDTDTDLNRDQLRELLGA